MSAADVLGRYPPGERPIATPTPLGSAGGLSGSLLWRYDAPNGPRVLRAWPEGTPLGRVERIHGWLRATADLPFVARPIAASDGSTAIEAGGVRWEVSPWLPGEPTAGIPPLPRVRAGFEGLAALHSRLSRVDARVGPSPGLAARRDELRSLIEGGFDILAARLSTAADDPAAADAREWLGLARRLAPGVLATAAAAARLVLPLHPCLRDARPAHFLFTADALTGLVDFGAMDVEAPAADLARLVGEWLPRGDGDDLRAEAFAAYGRSRPIGADELAAAGAFEELADVLVGERWARWRFLEGRRFDDDRATAAGIARGLDRARRLAAR
ncbi:aminoglycoside phosphotransferase family protein [Paludisphaera sp.]|uniref:aminoglycoside phosphotransferase family protein n=1 Tax=Paludisphaera sp. TaxID=2017432 RepID=UPI00301E2F36